MKTVAIQTHGCKLNQADSEAMAQRFVEAGYLVVDKTAGADVIVVNSCTVTATADAKARQALRAARRASGDALVVATGCYAQRASRPRKQLGRSLAGDGQLGERGTGGTGLPGAGGAGAGMVFRRGQRFINR